MPFFKYLARFFGCAVVAPVLVACGGSFATSPDSGGGGATAGGPASGGASAGSAGSSCAYQGKTYADGARFPASDGCNTCFCEAGSAKCTLLACSAGCQFKGQSYQTGQTFQVECNTCTCQADGNVSCTDAGCPDQCTALQEQYAAALKQAKVCDPKQPADQCTKTVSGTLGCGCETPANANNAVALSELSKIAQQVPADCNMLCSPCLPPGPATCSAAGSCEFAPIRPGEAACKVDGVIYASGSSGIQKPGDCNTCSCNDGELSACTKKGCPSEFNCPTGTMAGSQCAQCGPTDACQIVEHACLPTCTDACASGVCSNGICRQICG